MIMRSPSTFRNLSPAPDTARQRALVGFAILAMIVATQTFATWIV
jgi:hypothetical protein